jgi:hypothetical protein
VHLLRAALLPLLLVVAFSCGLPGNYYLEPPGPPTTPATPLGGSFQVNTTTRAGDIAATFLGYEYYYKCYGANDATLANDQVYGNESYDSSTLLAHGFHRLCRGVSNVGGLDVDPSPGASSPPVVNMRLIEPGDIGQVVTISLVINDINWSYGAGLDTGDPVSYLTYSSVGSPSTVAVEVRRFVADSVECKTFESNATSGKPTNWNFSAPDVDVTAAMQQQIVDGSGTMYIMMYAVSYGRGDDNSVVRSYPVYLGFTSTQVLL